MTSCSVVITTYNDRNHVSRLLKELDGQVCDGSTKLSVFHCESGDLTTNKFEFSNPQINYHLLHEPSLGRTEALNLLFKLSPDDLIIRLDARTHINERYIHDIIKLSERSSSAVVAGVMVPIGSTRIQNNNAILMNSRVAFGGGKFKDQNFSGYMNSVYLGAFKVNKLPIELKYDPNAKISEDSDFFYRLTNAGGTIWQSHEIKAKYFAREKLSDMISLAKNYGRGRALFVLKHGTFGSLRQTLPLLFYLNIIILGILGIFINPFLFLLLITLTLYVGTIWVHYFKNKLLDNLYLTLATVSIHLFWTLSFIVTYIKFIKKKLLHPSKQ